MSDAAFTAQCAGDEVGRYLGLLRLVAYAPTSEVPAGCTRHARAAAVLLHAAGPAPAGDVSAMPPGAC